MDSFGEIRQESLLVFENGTSDVAFWGAVLLFVAVMGMMSFRRIPLYASAVFGMTGAVLFRLISMDDALASIDMNVIFVIISMSVCVTVIAATGFFELIVIGLARLMRGNAMLILLFTLFSTMVLSAFFDNLGTLIIMIPLTILITQILEVPVRPFLILEVIAANIGSAATFIGSNSNIIIGTTAQISFSDFLCNAAPCVIIGGSIVLLMVPMILGRHYKVPQVVKVRVADFCPAYAIIDKNRMYLSLFVFSLMLLGFAFQEMLDLNSGFIAIAGMSVMLAVCRLEPKKIFAKVDWQNILLICGLFVVAGALRNNGVTDAAASFISRLSGNDLFTACLIILWGAGLVSAFSDNILISIVMVPVVAGMLPAYQAPGCNPSDNPLFWALVFGVSFGSCGSSCGSVANMTVCRMSGDNGYPISFGRYFSWGFPVMTVLLLISSLYIWFMYFY